MDFLRFWSQGKWWNFLSLLVFYCSHKQSSLAYLNYLLPVIVSDILNFSIGINGWVLVNGIHPLIHIEKFRILYKTNGCSRRPGKAKNFTVSPLTKNRGSYGSRRLKGRTGWKNNNFDLFEFENGSPIILYRTFDDLRSNYV